MTKPRILIVGAGPTGLTAALDLTRFGFEPTLVDRKSGPSGLSRAVGILPATMHLWHPSGVAAQIVEQAVKVSGVRIHKGAHEILHLPMPASNDPYHRMFGLPQNQTEHLLRKALEGQGNTVHFDTELTHINQTETSVTATLNGDKQRFDYVIAADGTRSHIRQSLHLDYRGFDAPGHWSIADVEASNLPDTPAARVFLLPKGKAVLVLPLSQSRVRVVSNTADGLAAMPIPLSITKTHRTGGFTVSVRQIERYRAGRIFFAGDAAHCHSPVGGRGMNLGVADAADLAARFANGTLDGYHTARHSAGTRVMGFSERMRGVLTNPNPAVRLATTTALRTINHLPPLKRRIAETMLQM